MPRISIRSLLLVALVYPLFSALPVMGATSDFTEESYNNTLDSNRLYYYLQFLPLGYDATDTSKQYPVIVYLHGNGLHHKDNGNGNYTSYFGDLSRHYNQGPARVITSGDNTSMTFTTTNGDESFIVLCLQQRTGRNGWQGKQVIPFVDHALASLNIDPNRVYLTGHSMGGNGTWKVATSSENNPNRFAAIAPVAANGTNTQMGVDAAGHGLPVWAFTSNNDGSALYYGTTRPINSMLGLNADPTPRVTAYVGASHGKTEEYAYSIASTSRSTFALAGDPVDPNGSPPVTTLLPVDFALTPHSSLYEWFLTQSLGTTPPPPPPTNQAPMADAGLDQSVVLAQGVSQVVVNLAGVISDDMLPNGTLNGQWSLLSGPTGVGVTFADSTSPTTTATFVALGTYELQLEADDSALTDVDTVVITITAEPVSGEERRILFDLGPSSTFTAGNWNNINNSGAGVKIADAIDDTGASTGIQFEVTSAFTATNGSGKVASDPYPETAQRDSFNVNSSTTATFVLSGLDAANFYDLSFFGSRSGTTIREGEVTVNALPSQNYNAANNISTVVTFTDVVPDSSGEITVTFNTYNGSGHAYLGVVDILEKVPEPAGGFRVVFDLGTTNFVTAGNYNNVTDPGLGVHISDAIDDQGELTGVSLEITNAFVNPNGSGIEDDVIYPSSVQRDSLFVAGTDDAQVVLGGLDSADTYTIYLFGSRAFGGDKTVEFSLDGGLTWIDLNCSNNVDTVIEFPNQSPDAQGEFVIDVQADDGSGFGYLGAIELIKN
ncbi:alpha/beta hydrolase-fold protein [Rubellicoccus peritrichatus]|uniref:Alpha/beta hydrolase-fold protein n=1 Tax=Rubellicoccus peritrichatus TaxID=3080537 RepID=A0AAQ3QXX6_9BACT|nr:alpha/beta hydrolase-fold protein [Puniceicoccus sp. CR14]WOO43260.1 alpha/beta hydrolase-fold protein [Puniceicoccus sp. CR14]